MAETNFTKEFVIADEKACKARWACVPDGKAFFCAFCGHDFIVGDEYRMIYTNDLHDAPMNPLTCRPCFEKHGGFDGMRKRWRELWDEYRTKFKFWYIR